MEYIPGSVRTRPGLNPAFAAIAGNPKVNGLKSFILLDGTQRLLAFTSAGELLKESSPGTLSSIQSDMAVGAYMKSTTMFGREYMAFSDGKEGVDYARHFDDVNLDKVSQVGPSEGPAAADSASGGLIEAGDHKVIVWYETRAGYWAKASPPVTWTAAGEKKVSLTAIPIGPANVRKRLVAFSATGASSYFHIPSKMVLNDNTTTTLEVDFSDVELLTGTNVDHLLRRIELPYAAGVTIYKRRTVWWGLRNKMQGWRNLSFDAGFSTTRPLGWTAGPSNAGGDKDETTVPFGFAYKITGDGATAVRGEIRQGAVTEAWGGAPLIEAGRAYTVRARVRKNATLTVGQLNIDLLGTGLNTVGLQVTAAQASSTAYAEFTAELTPAQTSIPSNAELRVFAALTPTLNGSFFLDEVEIFPSDEPSEGSTLLLSGVDDPEAIDGISGRILVSENDGQAIRAAFDLRGFLYVLKERGLHVSTDDGVNEPSRWSVESVSEKIGGTSIFGAGAGEDWFVLASRSGFYYLVGASPEKISQEIQPDWDGINWEFGHRLWTLVDTEHKRILVGAPVGAATEPNRIFYLDYTEGFGDPLAGNGKGRKWAPWFISANSAGLVERTTGEARTFLGNNIGNGKIYELLDGHRSDDGVAINNHYDTAFLSSTSSIGRQLFGYLTGTARGSGSLALTAFLPDGASSQALIAWALTNPSPKDFERMLRIRAERVKFRFGTNAVNAFFELAKLVAWAKPDPWAITRGHN